MTTRQPDDQMTLRTIPFTTKILMSISVLMALTLFIWSTFFVQSTAIIGSAAVVLMVTALSIPVGSILMWLGAKVHVPLFTVLLWAVIISPFADNHVVETLPRMPPPSVATRMTGCEPSGVG